MKRISPLKRESFVSFCLVNVLSFAKLYELREGEEIFPGVTLQTQQSLTKLVTERASLPVIIDQLGDHQWIV